MLNKKTANLKEIQDFLVKAGWQKIALENCWIKGQLSLSTQDALEIEVSELRRKLNIVGGVK